MGIHKNWNDYSDHFRVTLMKYKKSKERTTFVTLNQIIFGTFQLITGAKDGYIIAHHVVLSQQTKPISHGVFSSILKHQDNIIYYICTPRLIDICSYWSERVHYVCLQILPPLSPHYDERTVLRHSRPSSSPQNTEAHTRY